MKKILLVLALFSFIALNSNAQEAVKKSLKKPEEAQKKTLAAPAKPEKKAEKAQEKFTPDIKGVVVSLPKLASGADASVTKADAEKAQPLAVKSGDKVYLVYNAKNAFDGKSLIKLAEAKNIGIQGEVKTVNGFNVIVAKKIQEIKE